jgi:hypothetical protein
MVKLVTIVMKTKLKQFVRLSLLFFWRLKYIPRLFFRVYSDIYGWRTNENVYEIAMKGKFKQ